jgi:hypothetical protein
MAAPSSSLSTFLDVTAGATAAASSISIPLTSGDSATRAKVLVAVGVRDDWELATNVAARAEIDLEQVVSALGWLAQNKLVELRTEDGEIQVRLTQWAAEEIRAAAERAKALAPHIGAQAQQSDTDSAGAATSTPEPDSAEAGEQVAS